VRANQTAYRQKSVPSPVTSAWWAEVLSFLAPLRVGGLALLCLVPGYLLAPALSALSPRAGVWVQYLALGTLLPAAVAAIVVMERSGRQLPRLVRIALVAIPIVAVSLVAGLTHGVIAVSLAFVQTLICLAITSQHARVSTAQAVALFLTAFVAWAAVLEVLTWNILADTMPPSLPLFIAVAMALVACCWWAFGRRAAANSTWGRSEKTMGVVCVVALVLLAFRTDGLFATDRLGPDGTFYHWGALVGPAEAVRQGGWLLWDAPGPYGFLSTLTLAAFPASTAWQSLYLLNAAASALLAVWLFFTIRAVQPGTFGSLLALAASAAAVFFIPIWPPDLMPEHYFPMAGAFRYGWSYVLVGLLVVERRLAPGSHDQRLVLAAGCLSWLVSMLWSAESAFIGSAIWLPAFVLIVLRDTGFFAGKRNWKRALAWLVIPPVLLIAALGTVFTIYWLVLGHGPDAFAYAEPVLAFSGTTVSSVTGLFEGFGPNRTIAVILFGFLLLAMAASSTAMSPQCLRELPVLLGLALGLWGLASYAVGLPVPFAIFRFFPYLVLALALVLAYFVPRRGEREIPTWINAIRAGTIPILVAILATVYSNVAAFPFYVDAMRSEGFHGRDITAGLPFVDPSLQDLMQQAGVAASDPIYYAGGPYGDVMPRWIPAGENAPVAVSRQWLAGPLSAMALRPEGRKQDFIQRSAERQDRGGWLIERQQKDALVYSIGPWFFTQIRHSFVPAKIAANDDWQIVWYEPVDNWQQSFGGQLPAVGGPSLPVDISINGKSLADQVFPSVWGYFGPEWTAENPRKSRRCAAGRGTVNLFVSAPLLAELVFAISPADDIRVAINDGPANVIEVGRGRKVVAPVALEAGWNTVDIAVAVSSQPTENAPAPVVDHCGRDSAESWPLQVREVDLRFHEGQISR
jgi:hypothetical protein